MLDRLPSSLQQLVLLEWLSPKTVSVVARAGSSSLRRAVQTMPRAFRAAKGEVLSDACLRWFRETCSCCCCDGSQPLVLWTAVYTEQLYVHHQCNGKTHRDEDDLPAVTWIDWRQRITGHLIKNLRGVVPVPLWSDRTLQRFFLMDRFVLFYLNDDDTDEDPFHLDREDRSNEDIDLIDHADDGTQWTLQEWWRHDRRHRDGDLPAVVRAGGTKIWFQDGVIHRENDLPAIVFADGTQMWWRHGQQHRDKDDLPAVVCTDGTQMWYQHGKLHRDGDLPAEILPTFWQMWYQHGKPHREDDKPAMVWNNGTKQWYQNGVLHREGLMPAVIRANGTLEWWRHGQRHRDDAGNFPAIVNANGDLCWYLNGKLHRDGDRPAEISTNGTRMLWWRHGELHRDDDLPAVVSNNGFCEWHQHGKRLPGFYALRARWWWKRPWTAVYFALRQLIMMVISLAMLPPKPSPYSTATTATTEEDVEEEEEEEN